MMTGGQAFFGIVGSIAVAGGVCGLLDLWWARRVRRFEKKQAESDPRFDWKPTGRWRRSVWMHPSGCPMRCTEVEEARLVMDSGSTLEQTRWRRREPGEMWVAVPELEVSWKSE